MKLSFEAILIILLFLIYINIVLVFKLIMNKAKKEENKKLINKQKRRLIKSLFDEKVVEKGTELFESYAAMKQSIALRGKDTNVIVGFIRDKRTEKNNKRRLSSAFSTIRMEAAVSLGVIATEEARILIEKAVIIEKSYPVKIYMANALADIGDARSIPVLVSTLKNAHRWYRDKLNMILSDFGEKLHTYLPNILQNEEIEIKELIVDFSSIYISEQLKVFLLNMIDEMESKIVRLEGIFKDNQEKCCNNCTLGGTVLPDNNRLCKFNGIVTPGYLCKKYKGIPVSIMTITNYKKLVYKAAEVVSQFYFKELDQNKYLASEDPKLRNIAISALSNYNSLENLNRLISYLKVECTERTAINSILQILVRNPGYINVILKKLINESDPGMKVKLAEILSGRIEYFIMKLATRERKMAIDIIKQVLLLGKTNEVIGFLNINKDKDIENELVAIIKEIIVGNDELQKEFCTYLNERIIMKCGLLKCEELLRKREEKKEKNIINLLYSIMFVVAAVFPIIYLIRHFEIIFSRTFFSQIKIYILDFNYYLAFYSITINLIYIALLILSFINVSKQMKLWKLKGISLLFKKKMLPGITIIAPAFNEEKTIIESCNSLLNLKYPDYELILVNDGSKDNTLDVLIRSFDLKRIDFLFDYKLSTRPVRGVYVNRSIPKLIVVDKENGGKADSLNAGINISRKEYFCGIDADSLLEEEALLKLASQTLDYGVETPALGGNIFPINGCSVDRGLITDICVPKNKLARFQTVEYIRAFMAGRLGWDYMNSLLIISGAFGLFRKERIISIGGYLTSSGKYAKDTVGEDMELVVRISRLMRELGQKYRICYSFNANCWTEVPEDLLSLKKQRYRWHRGLIDILTFHRKVMFNPSYGRMGMFAMPYFLIFEMIGPLIEIQGYIMVLLAFVLGLLNIKIAVLLFVSNILLGMVVSIASVLIAEKDLSHFKFKDISILILYAILENFGPRQLFSFWRVGGYFKMFSKEQGWGKMKRKGFAQNQFKGDRMMDV